MKQIPILFSIPMVDAIINGKKTMTRRIIKPQPVIDKDSGRVFTGHKPAKRSPYDIHNWKEPFIDDFARWKVGDVLWVRESFRKYSHVDENGYTKFDDQRIEFAADKPPMLNQVDGDGFHMFNKDGTEKFVPWKPSIHMPKSVARIWLEVTEVRLQHLHDVSEADAIAEGVLFHDDEVLGRRFKDYEADASGYGDPDHDYPTVGTAKESFFTLWQSINGAGSWNENPWVWLISFKNFDNDNLKASQK